MLKRRLPNAVFNIRKLRTLPKIGEDSAEGNAQGRLYNSPDGKT